MKTNRVLNAVLAVVFLGLTVALPVRNLVAPRDYAAEATARGGVVFDADHYNAGASSATYIMLFLFGSLTLVFAWRAVRPPSAGSPTTTHPPGDSGG